MGQSIEKESRHRALEISQKDPHDVMECPGVRWWWLHSFVTILETNTLDTLKEWILWCMNYISIKKQVGGTEDPLKSLAEN